MSRLKGDGTAEPVSRTKFLGANADREILIFPVQLTTSEIGNLTRLIHTLAICVTIHTNITTCIFFPLFFSICLFENVAFSEYFLCHCLFSWYGEYVSLKLMSKSSSWSQGRKHHSERKSVRRTLDTKRKRKWYKKYSEKATSPKRQKENTNTHTHTHTQVSLIPPWEDQCEWHRMTRMTGPDCAVMCNLINTHTHTHTEVFVTSIIDPPLGGSMRVA